MKASAHSAQRRGERNRFLLLLSTEQSSTIALSCSYCFHKVVMIFGKAHSRRPSREQSFWPPIGHVEQRQWWLWGFAIAVTLLLTAGMASFSYLFDQSDPNFSFSLRQSVRGLFGLVLLFDLYTIYQQLQIQRIRRQISEREELYRLISENAEDLIRVIVAAGHQLYTRPAYARLLGFTM